MKRTGHRGRRFGALALLSVGALLAAILLGLVFGASGVGVGDVWALATGQDMAA